jgi:protein-S-isoprenylcysteine O-methyltransferase Ste14
MTFEFILKLTLFLAVSVWLAYISRASLRILGSHGFYRYFAWVCIFALFLLNVGEWFRNPFSPSQLISWLLLTISGFLILHAVYLLFRLGRRDEKRQDASLISIEKTTTLITTGAYRYIRHPMYSSLLFLGWGMFFKRPSWAAGVLAIVATCFIVGTAKADEAESIRFFGAPYEEYMKRTKMFVPFLF